MAGIYLHIPFCKQACYYCNFHFSTSLRYKEEMIAAICKEISLRTDYLQGEIVETIYFGGGTPSLLSGTEIEHLLQHIGQCFTIAPNAEITLEANPDDLTETKLQALKQTTINRFSIGIQSFASADLLYMNRAHNAQQALQCILLAQKYGFTNLSIDLIYGTPTLSEQQWQHNLQTVVNLGIPHISAYCLTIEPKTALQAFIKQGKSAAPTDEQAAVHFQMLTQILQQNGYQHYEISNFCLPNHVSKHNSSYWQGKTYLGIGPSAHSFNGISRQWNIANNAKYIKAIGQNDIPAEIEVLSVQNQYNEYLMTSLRTMWGCNLTQVQARFGSTFLEYLLTQSQKYLAAQQLLLENNILYLQPDARFIADAIIADLFI